MINGERMNFKIVNNGLNYFLAIIRANVFNVTLADLFVNNHTPAPGDALTDYTLPTWFAYGSQNITTWTSTTIVSNKSVTVSDPVSFTPGFDAAGATVYGYLVREATAGLLFAELFATPITVVPALPIAFIVTFRHSSP
jgi:hypothetical protein